MTLDEVKKRVAAIAAAAVADDDESAHSMEDELHQDVLNAIAECQCEDPHKVAAEALKTKEIDFARWCA